MLDAQQISFQNLQSGTSNSGRPDGNVREVCICGNTGELFLAPANSHCRVNKICG